MAEESRKSTRSFRSTGPSGGHSGDGSGAAFAKWMEDDAAEWPDRSGAHQRTAQSFDDELHGLSKDIKHAEKHLEGLKHQYLILKDVKLDIGITSHNSGMKEMLKNFK